MATATRKKSSNGRKRRNGSKPTPDLMGTLAKRGPGRPPKPAPTALEIADAIEKHTDEYAKNMRAVVAILRGEV